MNVKSKIIDKKISNHSANQLFDYFNFEQTKKAVCHELLNTQVKGGYSSGYTRLMTPKTGSDRCWFINSGLIMGIQNSNENRVVMLLFRAGDLAVLPDAFLNGQECQYILVACPDANFIEISRDTVLQLQALVSNPMEIVNKIACAPYKNYTEKVELTNMEGKAAILELHKRHPELKGPRKKAYLQDKYQAKYLGMNGGTFCKLKKEIYSSQGI